MEDGKKILSKQFVLCKVETKVSQISSKTHSAISFGGFNQNVKGGNEF